MKLLILLLNLFYFQFILTISNPSNPSNTLNPSNIPNNNNNNNPNNFQIFSYLPEWRYSGSNYNKLCLLTNYLIFFSLEPSINGNIIGYDRFPSNDIISNVKLNGCKILICFGGNGRSNGFSKMTRNKQLRKIFIKEVKELIEKYQFDGIDYNWEYPGYNFGSGYSSQNEVDKDYEGLVNLLKDTRQAIGNNKLITLAYYPDTRQEQILLNTGIATIPNLVNYLHIMAYDQNSGHHSSYEYGIKVVDQGIKLGLPKEKLTLGLPFYGRNSKTGDWTTYEDIVQKYHPLNSTLDIVPVKSNDNDKKKKRRSNNKDNTFITFNGINTISKKTEYAYNSGIGGVMVWEGGQDCRLEEVIRDGQTHVKTCPNGEESSLFVSIRNTIHKLKEQKNQNNNKLEL